MSGTATIKPRNAFARAVESFLRNVDRDEDVKSPFYKEVMSGLGQLWLEDCSPEQTSKCTEAFSTFVSELESRHRRGSKTRSVFASLQPLVNGLMQFASAFDVLIQAAPAAVQVLYGGARIVLQLAHSFPESFDDILEIMNYIGHLLVCYEKFSAAFASSEEMLSLLVGSYKNIICFWQKAAKLFSRKAYKTLLVGLVKPLRAEWQKCHTNLHRDCERVRTLAQAIKAELGKQMDLDIQKSRQEMERERIINWLKAGEDDVALDMRNDLQAHLNVHHIGTCTWLYNDPTFKAWDNATNNATVWYHAGPGSGKTVLASALTKYLQARGSKVIYFFHSFNDSIRDKSLHAIRCLVLQLLLQCDIIPEKVHRLYEADSSNRTFGLQNPETFLMLFQALLDCSSRTHVILDGLDECSDGEKMKDYLTRLIKSKTCGLVKWFLTSRHEHDIRSLAQNVGASDIVPSVAVVNADIRKYMEHRTNSEGHAKVCVERWTEASEGNFLWITLMHEILRGGFSTCDEDLEIELRKFPKGLRGCYLRGLQQIMSKSDTQQELARRIIVFLTIAKQPLHLGELRNALAIREGAEDHEQGRVPWPHQVQALCGHFVAFDYDNRGNASDPLLKLAHKSIQDFFLQDPESLGVSAELRRFFVDPKSAHLEVGKACLTYLQYRRYQGSIDIPVVLEGRATNEHSFLRYASTFWFRHLMETDHSTELLASVEHFVRSSAFWTCLEVQSKIAPHLFAKYVEGRPGLYRMVVANPNGLISKDYINFASPIPLWLDEYKPIGSAIALGVHSFVKEWYPVLTTHPSATRQCKSEVLGGIEYPSRILAQDDRVAIFDLLPKENMPGEDQRIQSVGFEKDRLYVTFIENQEIDSQRQVTLQKYRVPRKKRSGRKSLLLSLPQSTELTSGLYFCLGKDSTEPSFWCLGLQTLNLTRYLGSKQKIYNAPRDVKNLVMVANKGFAVEPWVIMSELSDINVQGGKTFACHCSKFVSNPALDEDSGYQSMDSGSEASDSDSDSDTDSTPNRGPRTSHCIILTNQDRPPMWFTWSTAAETLLQVMCALHPKEPIAVWTHAAHEIRVANLHTGGITLGILPEPVDAQLLTATTLIKELHFSECGKFLYYLLCSISEEGPGLACSVYVSTFEFSMKAGGLEPLQRTFTVQHVVHRFCESASSLTHPFLLTAWSPRKLLVALPKLYCDPKIIRFALSDDVNTASNVQPCRTLRAPVYFPSSTVYRRPRILLRSPSAPLAEESLGVHEHLILALDSEGRGATEKDSPQSMLPAIVMDWSISMVDGWRDWDSELDERSEELKCNRCTWDMLRGSFVDSEQRFRVPIRSGLNWTRKAFLSCG